MSYLDIVRAARKARKVRAEEEATTREHAPECEISEISEKSPDVQAEDAVPGFVPHPVLSGLRVYRGRVEPSTPPEAWDGAAPDDCGKPPFCAKLGPCPGWGRNGACPLAPTMQTEATA
jgi:hypothetical protein